MNIYFLRHGDASSDDNYSDSERPLTELGVEQANLIGAFLKQKNTNIDMILSSPLTRAKETASIVQDKTGVKKADTSDFLLNGTNQKELFEYLNKLNVSSVLLVGHIPHLENTISLIVTGKRENNIEMKKCSLALVKSDGPVGSGSGELNHLTHLDTIADLIKP
jgi:phosphohistidine phosphatase